MEKYITSNVIAETLGVSTTTARSIMREMPHFQRGGGGKRQILLVKQADFEDYMNERTIPGGAEEPRKTPYKTTAQAQEERLTEWHRRKREAMRGSAI